MSTSFTGGCQCGAVRYECSAAPLLSGNCHCRDCQKATGGAYVPVLAVPARALKITGEVKYYESRADSGNTFSRGFCPTCGGERTYPFDQIPEAVRQVEAGHVGGKIVISVG